ncbi:nuclear transport factor 2 family protein [Alteromonas facilis]|uniref:nuclear transport factor 2 family protein n=1 Tax=Alteromonas facilis TaxID=2048004 RepID=UPI000C281ADD|nr:nuclear transport factor 2 family protein [Alteromonas facilis]
MKKYLATIVLCLVSFHLFANPQVDNQTIAQTYFDAYIARDWQTLAQFLHEDGSFADTTAKPVFGDVSVAGKAETVTYFTKNYASIQEMSFTSSRQWVSGDVAIFEGVLNWKIDLGDNKIVDTKSMPFITILELKEGQVLHHRDYADYQPFLKAHAEMNETKSP